MEQRALAVMVALVILVTAAPGCGSRSAPRPSGRGAALGTETGSAAGIHWSVPARWSSAPERPMRVATYSVVAASGTEGGECGVFFFGSGQGGSVDENIERWVGQFVDPSRPERASRQVNGVRVTTVKVRGTYRLTAGPMMQTQGLKPNYRLAGAIVEAPQGLVFFKLTGDARSVEKAQAEFDAMIGSVARD